MESGITAHALTDLRHAAAALRRVDPSDVRRALNSKKMIHEIVDRWYVTNL